MRDRSEQEPSYDPRSWIASVPAPPPPAAHAARKSPRLSTDAGTRQILAMIGVAIAIAIVGALTAWLSRPAPYDQDSATVELAPSTIVSHRTLVVPGIADIAPSLAAIGVSLTEARAATEAATRHLGMDSGEVRLAIALIPQGDIVRLHALTATRADGSGVEVAAQGADAFTARAIEAKLERRVRFVRGELDGESFYSSAVSAGVSDVLIDEFANAFRYDFDMQREVAKGDVFEAGFEQRVTNNGETVGLPVLVYASLSTEAKARALYLHRTPERKEAEWFDSAGRSSGRALMRTPVEAARISSGFGMRGHPILGFRRMHRGTDFAAPTGTPIFASGDAVVTFAGMRGANGNFVRLRHDNGWDTLYLHMNRIAPGMTSGVRVVQGQQIGEVGTTGRSTGPHLHYEVHIDGEAVDPLSIDTGSGRTMTGKALKEFRTLRDEIDAARVAGD